jgi:hypothetical protein
MRPIVFLGQHTNRWRVGIRCQRHRLHFPQQFTTLIEAFNFAMTLYKREAA